MSVRAAACATNARQRLARLGAVTSLLGLIILTLLWELWLAPLRPGGSWLALKTLPLVLAAQGIVRGRVYTYRWSTMLVLAYCAEGTVRVYTDEGMAAVLAVLEIALAVVFFTTAIAYVRSAPVSRSAAATVAKPAD